MIDVVTFGETMLRLTAPSNKRFQQSTHFEIHIGGSESNVAVGLARLGLKVAWLSRLTDNPLGQMIDQAIAAHGVDTRYIVWSQEQRNGLYLYEEGISPRPSRVIYDRKDSAFCFFTPQELPGDLFQKGRIKLFHTSGISLAVSPSARQTTDAAIQKAKASGAKISFDLNYRGKLWSKGEAKNVCEPFLKQSDICFLPLRDALSVLQIRNGTSSNPREVIQALRDQFPHPTIVMTDGERGAWAADQSEIHHQEAFTVTSPVGRLGGGDSFAAGFLKQYLSSQTLKHSLLYACAAAALKYTQPGDLPFFSDAEIRELISTGNRGVDR